MRRRRLNVGRVLVLKTPTEEEEEEEEEEEVEEAEEEKEEIQRRSSACTQGAPCHGRAHPDVPAQVGHLVDVVTHTRRQPGRQLRNRRRRRRRQQRRGGRGRRREVAVNVWRGAPGEGGEGAHLRMAPRVHPRLERARRPRREAAQWQGPVNSARDVIEYNSRHVIGCN